MLLTNNFLSPAWYSENLANKLKTENLPSSSSGNLKNFSKELKPNILPSPAWYSNNLIFFIENPIMFGPWLSFQKNFEKIFLSAWSPWTSLPHLFQRRGLNQVSQDWIFKWYVVCFFVSFNSYVNAEKNNLNIAHLLICSGNYKMFTSPRFLWA